MVLQYAPDVAHRQHEKRAGVIGRTPARLMRPEALRTSQDGGAAAESVSTAVASSSPETSLRLIE